MPFAKYSAGAGELVVQQDPVANIYGPGFGGSAFTLEEGTDVPSTATINQIVVRVTFGVSDIDSTVRLNRIVMSGTGVGTSIGGLGNIDVYEPFEAWRTSEGACRYSFNIPQTSLENGVITNHWDNTGTPTSKWEPLLVFNLATAVHTVRISTVDVIVTYDSLSFIPQFTSLTSINDPTNLLTTNMETETGSTVEADILARINRTPAEFNSTQYVLQNSNTTSSNFMMNGIGNIPADFGGLTGFSMNPRGQMRNFVDDFFYVQGDWSWWDGTNYTGYSNQAHSLGGLFGNVITQANGVTATDSSTNLLNGDRTLVRKIAPHSDHAGWLGVGQTSDNIAGRPRFTDLTAADLDKFLFGFIGRQTGSNMANDAILFEWFSHGITFYYDPLVIEPTGDLVVSESTGKESFYGSETRTEFFGVASATVNDAIYYSPGVGSSQLVASTAGVHGSFTAVTDLVGNGYVDTGITTFTPTKLAYSFGTFAVGDPNADTSGLSNCGAASLFNTDGSFISALAAPAPAAGDLFGSALTVSTNYYYVSAISDGSNGEVHYYNKSTGAFVGTIPATVTYPSAIATDFGTGLASNGSLVYVGAPNELSADSQARSGLVYAYNETGTLQWTLENPNTFGTTAEDRFGYKIAVGEGYLAVLARGEDNASTSSSNQNAPGVIYIYTDTGTFLYEINALALGADEAFEGIGFGTLQIGTSAGSAAWLLADLRETDQNTANQGGVVLWDLDAKRKKWILSSRDTGDANFYVLLPYNFSPEFQDVVDLGASTEDIRYYNLYNLGFESTDTAAISGTVAAAGTTIDLIPEALTIADGTLNVSAVINIVVDLIPEALTIADSTLTIQAGFTPVPTIVTLIPETLTISDNTLGIPTAGTFVWEFAPDGNLLTSDDTYSSNPIYTSDGSYLPVRSEAITPTTPMPANFPGSVITDITYTFSGDLSAGWVDDVVVFKWKLTASPDTATTGTELVYGDEVIDTPAMLRVRHAPTLGEPYWDGNEYTNVNTTTGNPYFYDSVTQDWVDAYNSGNLWMHNLSLHSANMGGETFTGSIDRLSIAITYEASASPPSGTLAVTEDFPIDVLAASGTVETPAGPTGTLAVTEDFPDDTLAASGTVINTVRTGTLAVTEDPDTFAGLGEVEVTGTLAVTEDPDILAASGTVANTIRTGTLAVTEGDVDTFAGLGEVEVSGTLVVTEDPDVFASTGTVAIEGTLAVTEDPDILAATGSTSTLTYVHANLASNTYKVNLPEGYLGFYINLG